MKKIHDEVHHFEAECTGSDKKTTKVEPKQKQIKVSGMKDLQKLDHEVFVLNPTEVIKKLPKAFVTKYNAKIRKDDDIEITVTKDMILNDVFADITKENISI